MTLIYITAALISLLAYAAMRAIGLRGRVWLPLGIFVFLAALATWLRSGIGDDARPGSIEVQTSVPGAEPTASKPSDLKAEVPRAPDQPN